MRFAYLDGAVIAAREIGEWALRSGFGADNVRVVDDGASTAMPRSRSRANECSRRSTSPFLQGAEVIEQLILAFAAMALPMRMSGRFVAL